MEAQFADGNQQKPTENKQVTAMMNDSDLQQWHRVREKIRAELGGTQFKSWIEPVVLSSVTQGIVTLCAQTNAGRDWIRRHFGDKLRAYWRELNPEIRQVDICVEGRASAAAVVQPQNANVNAISVSPPFPAPGTVQQTGLSEPIRTGMDATESLSLFLDCAYTFENFVVGKPNEFAYAAARRVAESGQAVFNPLFLYGGSGLGKTHLMHAIAWHIRRHQPHRQVIYLTAEKFMYRFVRALQDRNTLDFKDQFRNADVLMVDDVQFITGKDATQEEFFHTFNALVDQGRQVVVSADKGPSSLSGMEERLRSRLGSGLTVDLHETTYELRLGILENRAAREGVVLPRDVAEILARRIQTNVRVLEGALTRLIANAQLIGRDITLDLVHETLHDLLRKCDRKITVADIQKKVADHFRIKPSEMTSKRRSRNVARPRQVAMYLSKHLTDQSLPSIGTAFGGRDHTTVLHAIRKVDELQGQDALFAEDVEHLTRLLKS